MRKPIIAGNWKMNTDREGAIDLAREVKRLNEQVRDVDVVLIPPFVFLDPVQGVLEDSSIALGAQQSEYREKGAFTGEISVSMLRSVGCEYVLCGHSERRSLYGETNELVHAKVKAALAGGLKPILCIGETKAQRDSGATLDVIFQQLEEGLFGLTENDFDSLVLAYEPVWAIGTGDTATPEQAQDVHAAIREWVERTVSASAAEKVRIQYGGSVKPSNVKDLMSKADIDGALVGGASLTADSFTDIIRFKR